MYLFKTEKLNLSSIVRRYKSCEDFEYIFRIVEIIYLCN